MHHRIAAALLLAVLVAPDARADDLAALGNPLRYIASAVDGAVRYDPEAADLSGLPLIEHATRNDPTLLSPFRNSTRYALNARREGRHSSVLLCAGDTALFEDAGCTGGMDWNGADGNGENRPRPCAFALDLAQVCARPPRR